MQLVDKILTCCECGKEFVHDVDEQKLFQDKGFTKEPRRCRRCRAKKKLLTGVRIIKDTPVVCSACGLATTVPFKPVQNRPVYCRSCFSRDARG